MADYETLRTVIREHPLIDNHAHNLLHFSEYPSFPLESSTTEAGGEALQNTFKSLQFYRAAQQLKELYGCEKNADWEAVQDARAEWLKSDPVKLVQMCLAGTYSILMDDGLSTTDRCFGYEWHSSFTQAPTKRIVRIEAVAAELLKEIADELSTEDVQNSNIIASAWQDFNIAFDHAIKSASNDSEVAGFKSVICYRTGLDVSADPFECREKADADSVPFIKDCYQKQDFRIDRKAVNDWLVVRTLEILSSTATEQRRAKPLQFHTGLGDADINLLRSNPAYLQPLIENNRRVPFILLHSAYPYTREAGYLATVFSHVYLDIGQAIPQLSRDGQISVIRQALELVPSDKLLWSTDGHFLPETYWLANKQIREDLEEVLIEYVRRGDLSEAQAIDLMKDLLFNNSNRVYNLNFHSKNMGPPVIPKRRASVGKKKLIDAYNLSVWDTFRTSNPNIEFVYVQWLDYNATMRVRVLPVAAFEHLVRTGGRIGISRGNTGTLQNDHITPAVNACGQIYVEPDLKSLRPAHEKDPLRAATVMASWRNEYGVPISECPRSGVEKLLHEFSAKHNLAFTIGFEIEVTFLRRVSSEWKYEWEPLTMNHAWSTLTPDQWTQGLPLMAEITKALDNIGIPIQQFHAESAAGQFEFVLPPLPALNAIDTLVQARQVITQIAALHNLRATLHPMPLPGIGTAAHAHISLGPASTGDARTALTIVEKEMQFFAGVLAHLEAICAFAMPEKESYGRVLDDSWTGGTWVAWGTQNRETPLRRVNEGRWEIRCLDGMANMYLALGAILAAGLRGIRLEAEMRHSDCLENPARLDAQGRRAHGIERQLPRTLDAALAALERDGALKEVLADGLVNDFIVMKREEQKMLGEMSEDERRMWLIDRY